MNKGEIAKENFLSGYNCSVAVALAFREELNLTETQIKKLFIGFGGGLARQRLTCGAISAMTAVLSFALSDGENKAEIYALISEACAEFKNETGSLVCGELLSGIAINDSSTVPEKRTAEYYKKRPCADICALATTITDKYLKSCSAQRLNYRY